MFYNFFKLMIFNSIVELIWPTNIFNKKQSSFFFFIKYRTFNEVLLKLRPNHYKYNVFNNSFIKYYLVQGAFKEFPSIFKNYKG